MSFEVELFRDVRGGTAFLDGALLSAGLDVGSALLGERRFFNPHLGVRAGCSAMTGRVDFAAGVTAGVEVVHLRNVRVDAQVRLWGFFGNRAGAHLGVQSGVVATFGF